jgi:hypothetical protein
VITGLLAAFSTNVEKNPEIPVAVKQQVDETLSSGGSFVTSDQVRTEADAVGVDPATTDILVAEYEDSQLKALKTALLVAALLVLASLPVTRNLPDYPLGQPRDGPEAAATA